MIDAVSTCTQKGITAARCINCLRIFRCPKCQFDVPTGALPAYEVPVSEVIQFHKTCKVPQAIKLYYG